MKMNYLNIGRALCGLLLLPGGGTLLAAETTENNWKFSFSPYAWGSSLKGKVASLPGLPPADLDISLGDILSNLNIGFMGVGGARKGRFSIYSDLFYSHISADADTRGRLYSGADYTQTLFFASAGIAWRVMDEAAYNVSVLAALRYYRLDNHLKLDGAALPSTKIDDDEDWVDLLVGVQGRVRLAENWYANARVTTAIAGGSDTAYGLSGGVGYIFNKSVSTHVGYRYLKIDYENNDFLYDVKMFGPTIALAFHW